MNQHLLRIIQLFLFLIGISCYTMAENHYSYYSYTLGVSDGLSSQTTFNVVKADDGFIWIATRQGVDMYNGASFKHYDLFQNDIRTIYDGHKISVYRGCYNELWAYTDSGQIYYYDINSDTFKLFLKIADHKPGSHLYSLTQVEKKLYLCLTSGVECVDISRKAFTHTGLSGIEVRALIPYKENTLLAGSQTGIYILDASLNTISYNTSTSEIDVQTLFWEQSEDKIWIGSNGRGAWIWSKNQMTQISQPGLSSCTVRSIQQIDKYHLLLGSDCMGIYKIGINEYTPQLFASDNPQQDLLLSSSAVYDIIVDDGNIWVATYMGGVTLLRKNKVFRWLKNRNSDIRSENFVHGVCEDTGGKVWMAFNSSIGCFDRTTNDFKSYLDRQAGFLALALDDAGYLWCGGYSSGVYRLNTQTGNADFYTSIDGNHENDCVYAVYKDKEGDIWIGGLNFRLTRLAIDGNKFRIRQHYDIKQVQALCSISKDSLLVGTATGFSVLNTQSGEITSLLKTSDSTSGWTGTNFINSMAYTNGKDLWLGTDGGGLLCYNLGSKQLATYTTKEGLPSNYIMSMQTDSQNRLWISTENSGLFVFDYQKKKYIAGMKRYEGLFFNDFFPNASCLLSDGHLIFGGYDGAIVFSPSAILPQSKCRQICFIDLRVGAEPISMNSHPNILKTPLNQMERLTLPYQERTFTLEVSTNDLYNQSAYQLYYRLKGYVDEWKTFSQQRSITYTNLPPGKYLLQIRSNDSDTENDIERSVEIVVQQTIWLRWYVFGGYLLIICGLFYWGMKTYKSRIESKQSDEKIQFFTNVAHDIRTPLTLVTAPLDKLNKLMAGSDDQEKHYLLNTAMKSIHHLQDVVNQLTDFNKLGLSKELIHWQTVNLNVQLSIIRDVYLSLAKAKGIDFKLNCPTENYQVHSDSSLLYRVLDNLLSNALKYTTKGSVEITLSSKGQYALIEVADTGIGISPESSKKIFRHYFRGENAINGKTTGCGIGLVFTYKLVNQLGGKLSFKSKLNVGTSFYLHLPLTKSEEAAVHTPEIPVKEETVETSPPLENRHSIHKENVLLVEDNDELRQFLSHILAEFYNVAEASCAEEALPILQELNPDLIISDIMMPGMNGNEFCKHLKNNIETSHIPVILLTANTNRDTMTDGLTIGADDYITKPFDLDVLLLKIRNIFAARKKLHAYYLAKMQIRQSAESPIQRNEATALKDCSIDDTFLQKLMKLITDNLSNSDFTVNNLSEGMAMSRTLLYEKIRKLLGMAPNDLIRDIRMKQAKAWLEEGNCSVTDVAFKCGYPDSRYFSTAFKKYFGVSPSTIIPDNQADNK